MNNAHPNCTTAHACQRPSGRVCVEPGCNLEAGTLWGPYWCPDHDRDRLNGITATLEEPNQ